MSTMLPPVILQIKATARDAYTELAKFQAATAAAMKAAAAEVTAGGKQMETAGKKVGERTGKAVGKGLPPSLAQAIKAGLRQQSFGPDGLATWLTDAMKPVESGRKMGVAYSRELLRSMGSTIQGRAKSMLTPSLTYLGNILSAAGARIRAPFTALAARLTPLANGFNRLKVAGQHTFYMFGALGQVAKEWAVKAAGGLKAVYAKSGPLRWMVQGHIAAFRLLGKVAGFVGGKLVSAFKAALPFIGIAASSVGLLALTAGAAATKIVALGRGIAALGPLVAFLPSIIGGFKLLKTTLSAVTKGIKEDLKPVTRAFDAARKSAEEIGSRGFRQIGLDFNRVNMPVIRSAMESIADTANRSGRALGKWANSAPGMKLIRDTSNGVAAGFKVAAPAIERAVEALGRLANKANIGKRMEGIGASVGRLADRFAKWADSKSADDISRGLKTAGDALKFVGDKIRVVRDAVVWMADNRDKVKQFSDAFAVLGIAIGVATGNPIAIAIGGFTLLANHWDTVKAKLGDAGDWWKKTWTKVQQDPSIIRIVQASKDNWNAFKEGFESTLDLVKSQWDKVWPDMKRTWDEVGPTIAAGWEMAKPFVKAFGQMLGIELAAMGTGIRMFLGVVRGINAVFLTVATFVGQAIRTIMGAIAAMVDGAASVVGVMDKDLANSMRNAADNIRDQAGRIQDAIDQLHGKDLWIRVNVRGASGLDTNNKLKANPDKYGSNATGTKHWRGGPTWVGEYGPEIVELPRGASVHRAGASALMARGVGGDMSSLGSQAAAGLAAGMGAGSGGLTAAASAMASLIPATTAKVLEIRSPSKRMARLGTSILTGVQRGMEQEAPKVFKYLRAFANRIATIKVSTALRTRVQNIASAYLPKFNALKSLDDRVQAQVQRVNALKQARSQFAGSVAGANYGGAASLIGAIPEKGQGGTGYLASDYARVLEQRAKQLAAFKRNLATLKGRGVSKTVLSQFASAGYEQAGSLVESLSTANSTILRNVNKQTSSLATGAKGLGNAWAGEMYTSGVRAAEGVLKGLRSRRAAMAREMAALARSLVAAIKKALRIKSPSGVMADEVGRMIPEGVARGVIRHAGKAVAAVNGMVAAATPKGGRAAVRGLTPGQSQVMLPGGPAGGSDTVTVVVMLDGREIQRSVQQRSLRRETRNGSNGLSARTGR